MRTADLLVRALEQEGVTHVFGVPGEENLDFLDALRASSIRFILTRHEQGAGFMAATFGRLTGVPGVCLSTLGPGATNMITPAAYAQLGGMPLIIITGQKPIKHSKQGQFQIVRMTEIMTPVTKWSRQIVSGVSAPGLVREAFRRASFERPGAVHLELPEDVAKEETDAALLPVQRVRRPIAEQKAIAQAVEIICKAKRPLVVIGAAANRRRTHKSMLEFIEKTRIPFLTTQMGKGVIDERHPLYIGTTALSDGDFVHCALQRTDLIVNVGHDSAEKPPFIMRPGGPAVLHVNFYPAVMDAVYYPETEVIGDIANAIWQITEKIQPQQHWDSAYFMRVKKKVDAAEAGIMGVKNGALPQDIVAAVRSALPDDGIVSLDNGLYKLWFARNYRTYQPQTLLLDNALATMGAGLPQAMAAKIFYPERKVVAVVGDGGFMMNSQEMETAVRLGLDLTVVILRDNGFGMIQWKQNAEGLVRFGLDYGNPDFVRYAESYGAKGHRAQDAEQLQKLLDECLSAKGVQVIEVAIDYSQAESEFGKIKAEACEV